MTVCFPFFWLWLESCMGVLGSAITVNFDFVGLTKEMEPG